MYINESSDSKKYVSEKSSLIRNKLEIDDVFGDIDHLLNDLSDSFHELRIQKGNFKITVKYKRKNTRFNQIELPFNSTSEPSITKTILNNFIDYLEIATEIGVEYEILLNCRDLRIESKYAKIEVFQNFYKELQNFSDRLIAMGFGVHTGLHRSDYNNASPFSEFSEYIDEDIYRLNNPIYFYINNNYDPNIFKPDYDPSSELPSNIIDDFNSFITKVRMNNTNKTELVNILKRADWVSKENKTNENKFL